MAAHARPEREPEFEGGAQPVPERPPDEPGKARVAAFLLVALLGLLTLAMPVAWGIGILASVGETLGSAGLIALWVVWGIVVVAFVWSVWAMWQRAA